MCNVFGSKGRNVNFFLNLGFDLFTICYYGLNNGYLPYKFYRRLYLS